MKTCKKIVALLLAAAVCFAVFAAPVQAAAGKTESNFTTEEKISNRFYQLVDQLISLLGKFLNMVIPGLNWTKENVTAQNYETGPFYPGKAAFDPASAANAQWQMGFAERSILTAINATDGSCYMAGKLEFFEGRPAAGILDDQGVNAFALSDGETTVVYASVDGYGLARGDVQEIRGRLADSMREYGVDSVNVSALHQHSGIDTLGFGAPLLAALLVNPGASLFYKDKIITGRDPAFMEALYSAVAAAAREAVETMTPGALYYGSADISDYIKDKREPIVFDGDFQRLRFVPEDASRREIWVCETGVHPVTLGASGNQVSGDYPYYIEQYVNENADADLVFIQGAELAITSRTETLTWDNTLPQGRAAALGQALGERLTAITDETALEPLLNIAHRELFVPIDNEILTIAGREGLLGSVFVQTGLTSFSVVTEIGYMELGGRLGVLLVPGEIDPAILWGGATAAADSWTGEDWPYAPLAESCGAEKLICFGLCNDQIGYILCDNDVRSMLTENEEVNAASRHAGSILTQAYEDLFDAVK